MFTRAARIKLKARERQESGTNVSGPERGIGAASGEGTMKQERGRGARR